jgi:thiol-disulfide isomerase/thioredoxin
MKIKFAFFVIIVLVLSGCKNNTVEINGKLIDKVQNQYIYLDELKTDKLVTVDSVKVNEKGTFSFKKDIPKEAFYLLKANENSFLTLLLSPGEKITLEAYKDSLNYPVKISGSTGTSSLVEYNHTLRATIKKLGGLNKVYMQHVDSTDLPKIMASLDSLAQIYLNDINAYTKEFIDKNLNSLASLVALYQQVAQGVYVLNPSKDLSYFVKVDSSLSLRFPGYNPVTTLHGQVTELKNSLKGKPDTRSSSTEGMEVPEIVLPTPAGDTVKLSSTRGSVVLLDFWASWCVPCRKENPNLVVAYNKYHKKGFQIFQVSLDKTKEDWLKGIKDDKLEKWIHVSDVQYWNSAVVPLYKIESIPANYLLDKDGKVIASNLRGQQLEKKLEELFK